MPQSASVLVENAFLDHLKINNILSNIVDETSNEQKPIFEEIFNVPPIIAKAAVDDLTTVGFGVPTLKAEAADIDFQDTVVGYKTRYTFIGFGNGYSLSHEYQINEQYGFTGKLTRQQTQAAWRGADIIAANIFNSGGSLNTTYLSGGDGFPLFSTAHPAKRSADLSNDAANAADISVVSLQEQIVLFEKQQGNNGEFLDHEARMILVPTEAWFDAQEVISSPGRPDTAERARNVLMDNDLTVKKWKRLNDADTWFILDKKENHELYFRWREKPNGEGWIEKKSRNFLYSLFMMLAVGHSDWRGVRRIQGA